VWFYDSEYVRAVTEIGSEWGESGNQPGEVRKLWSALLAESSRDACDCSRNSRRLWETCLKLLAIADEAAAGIGFIRDAGELPFSDFFSVEHFRRVFHAQHALHLPCSICDLVPPTEVCVQPKTRTSQVGCTLRSLSHHLSLLPSIGEVKTTWMLASEKSTEESKPLNLLLIPFPYRIHGDAFMANDGGNLDAMNDRFFSVEQTWLKKGKARLSARALTDFILDLMNVAEREVDAVHGVILPEGALSPELAPKIGRALATKKANLEIFIAGTTSGSSRNQFAKNSVYASIFPQLTSNRVMIPWEQGKHHRWKLDRDQIRRYHLGHVLNPEKTWWERIDISDRQCHFYVFRYGATLATLVCEDLARIDPVQTVLRSVGPNLVVALLMDGPQLERRWPGRYAMVLADDPGSAVLTLTCLGMVRRSNMPGEKEARQIALWKDSSRTAEELNLPDGCHGLLLTVSSFWENNMTFDRRPDNDGTLRLALSGVRGIKHARPPAWVD
jgi:hypothetical protein